MVRKGWKAKESSSHNVVSSSLSPRQGRIPDPEGNVPPLPDPIMLEPIPEDDIEQTSESSPAPDARPFGPLLPFRRLRGGCYLLRYTPSGGFNFHYDGTLRVEANRNSVTASGDLYHHRVISIWPFSRQPAPASALRPASALLLRPLEPSPGGGIPIFPRSKYTYYVRVTQIPQGRIRGKSLTLGFELHRYNFATRAWTNEGQFTAKMVWGTVPAGYPAGADYLTGQVKNASGATVGDLVMGWVSPYLRRAVIEIDRVNVAEAALNNGAGADWRAIFDQVGWDMTIAQSNANILEPSGESWSDAEMHAEMLARRDMSNLDAEWRYHLLCVRRLDSTSRGIMYDIGGTDSNNIPREGAGISSHWMIPNTADWGLVQGMRFGTATAPYFRTAVHELGHAMGLYHNTVDLGIMNTTDVIAANGTVAVPFPNNIQWAFAPDDQKRLRHMPDIWVRPGGIAFGSPYSTAPISVDDFIENAEGLEFSVSPMLVAVPIGAPVRVNLTLANPTDQPLPVPSGLSLKKGFVKGQVIDPSGTVRTFSPIVRCVEEEELQFLEPGKSITDSLTLLRGAQGALFQQAGLHRIIVECTWDLGGGSIGITGETMMMVTPAVDEAHAVAALDILSTPDALLTLVLGGDHLDEGVQAIQTGLNNPVLRPHYAYVEAKRIGRRFGKRKANLKAAADLIEDAIMSASEIKSATRVVQAAEGNAAGNAPQRIAKTLRSKLEQVETDDETASLVESLQS